MHMTIHRVSCSSKGSPYNNIEKTLLKRYHAIKLYCSRDKGDCYFPKYPFDTKDNKIVFLTDPYYNFIISFFFKRQGA